MRRATIRTDLANADAVAASVRPDNTPEMEMRVDGTTITTTIERGTTGGLQSTVDDYVVNLAVATDVTERGIGMTNDDQSDYHNE